MYYLSKLELIYKVQGSHTYLTMAPALAPINTIQLANATPAAKSLPLFPPPRLTALPKINPAPNVNILPGNNAIVAIKYTSTYTSEPIYIFDDTQYKKLVMDVDIYLVVSESTMYVCFGMVKFVERRRNESVLWECFAENRIMNHTNNNNNKEAMSSSSSWLLPFFGIDEW